MFIFGKVFSLAVSLAAIAAGILVLFSFLGPWLPVADSVAHFRFHLAAAMLLAAVLLGLVGDWRRAAYALAVCVAGAAGMAPAFPSRSNTAVAGDGPTITAVQLNLSFRNTTLEAVAEYVRREGADIVTLQEVTARTGRVLGLLRQDYPAQVFCPFSGAGGVAVLSRLPRAPGGAQGCAEGQGMAWMQVLVGGQPVSVASLHLHWPYPFRQEKQIGRLETHLREIPRPLVLAGDFNAAPWSHATSRIAAATDTAVAAGLRFSFDIRVAGWAPPVPMPIDHILLPDSVLPIEVRLGPRLGSDHRSVVAKLAVVDEPARDQTALAPDTLPADRY